MSRPTDWTPVGYGHDPVPGDPSLVRTIGRLYVGTADSIDRAATNLRTALDDDFGRAEVIDAIRDQALEVAGRITRAEERYRGVGDAMIAYAAVLQKAQDDSAAALDSAIGARGDESSARWWVDHYQSQIDDPATPPANLAHLRSQQDTWETRLTGAQSDRTSAEADVATAVADRDRGAEVAIGAIALVESSGELNDGFWDNVSQWVAEHKDVLDMIGNVLGWIAAAVVVLALFIPGVNLLAAAALVLITANLVYAVANGALQVATGNMSLGEAIFNVGLAALNFLAIGAITKAATTTARTGAIAAFRAVPGASRTGSRLLADAVFRTATTTEAASTSTQLVWKLLGLSPAKWAPIDFLAQLGQTAAKQSLQSGYAAASGWLVTSNVLDLAFSDDAAAALPQPVLPWRLYGDPEFVGMTSEGTPVVVNHYGRW